MKKVIGWFITILIAFSVVGLQFIMESTYPLVIEVNTGKQRLQCELKRSYSGKSDCPVILPIGDILVSGYILYRNYPSETITSRIDFNREGDKLIAKLPKQPLSGKLEYRVFFEREGTSINVNEGKPFIIRFLGSVPLYIQVLLSLFIFFAILYITYSGFLAGFGIKTFRWMILLVVALLQGVLFIFQPLMHKYVLYQ